MKHNHPPIFASVAAASVAAASVAATALLLIPAAGCARVTVDPIEVKPIHITMDITLRVDRSLDDFFAGVENQAPSSSPAAATQPTVTP